MEEKTFKVEVIADIAIRDEPYGPSFGKTEAEVTEAEYQTLLAARRVKPREQPAEDE